MDRQNDANTLVLAGLAKDAIAVQDACNLSGVVHSFAKAMNALGALGIGTDARNRHPVSILYSSKIADLTGSGITTEFGPAYAWAKNFGKREAFDREHGVRTDGQIHLGPINLDGMSVSDLEIAAEHPALHRDVRDYAELKSLAMRHREAGEIQKASDRERHCEDLYNVMPKSVRW